MQVIQDQTLEQRWPEVFSVDNQAICGDLLTHHDIFFRVIMIFTTVHGAQNVPRYV